MTDETPNAILHTRYLDPSVKRSLAWGLEARWLELERDSKAGYGKDATKGQRETLIRDARTAYAVGLLTHLPTFARYDKAVERKAKRARNCNCP